MRLIRVMCSGRVDLEFIFRAFSNGHDGVFIGGCKLDECNYVTHGNYDAYANTYIAKKILARIGLNPDRLRTDFMSGADGHLLAKYTDEFSRQITELGPLGSSENMDPDTVKFKLKAARNLVPFLRLAEREKLRVPEKSKKAYQDFFTSSKTDDLFDRMLTEKLAISQILLLLKEKPMSTGDLSQYLGLPPSDVSRHMQTSSRHGMVRYDTKSKCYERVAV